MWTTHSHQMFQSEADRDVPRQPQHHNIPLTQESSPDSHEGGPSSGLESTAVPTPQEGTWGERDMGEHVTQRMAMEDFEAMRRELTQLSHQRSRSRSTARKPERRASILRSVTGRSVQRAETRATAATTDSAALEDGADETKKQEQEEEEDFKLDDFMREGHFERRKDGESRKKVGVVFKNLTVKGEGSSTTSWVKTLPDAIRGTFGPDLYRLVTRFLPALRAGRHGTTRDLIHDFTGVVRDGEMLLVLGRPGSGCSTFLKAIANQRDAFAGVTGDVSYGGISAEKQKRSFRGEVSYNPEEDRHFPTLTVYQTLLFALTNKTKKHEQDRVPIIVDALMKIFGISHTRNTLVGDEYTPGVSGGERKRVGIAETLATKSTVVCWDNSTRGLDASTALDYARSLRIMTDISNRTTLTTLYQAGEGIYELMDKVLVIDQGRCVYLGPAHEAKQYFLDLGYLCPERQTTADFLSSVTDPVERRFRDGFEASAPRTPEELERVFRNSLHGKQIPQDVAAYERELQENDHADAKEFTQAVREGKSRTVPKGSSYTVSFPRQVLACTRREFWLLFGDKTTLYTKFFIIVSNGLIVGSLFYGEPSDTAGAFSRGGALFFSILFLGWLQLSELMKAVSGRPVIARHHEYAFYRPSAVSIARVVADFPILLVQVSVFTIIMYFMTNLDLNVSKFWIYYLFVYTITICITSMYRMFAALSPAMDDAVRFSGIALNLLIIYTGYVIPKPQLLGKYIWFGWLYYVNPIAYAFEAVLTNEFTGRSMECDPEQLVPQGPGFGPPYQGCSLQGAPLGTTSVTGEEYFSTEFAYSRSNLWRNFGVVIAFTVLYIIVTAVASEVFSFVGGGGGATVFKKSKKAKQLVKTVPADEERGGDGGLSSDSSGQTAAEPDKEEAFDAISSSESVFTWTDVEYSVPYEGGQKKLLNKVSGYVKPGVMVALMGASGAGKTTLLNTLAQRQRVGVVGGDMLVDGRPLGIQFQRGTGFCEQMDLHDGTATVREALEFSAILRQERHLSRKEKLDYVDKVVELLELHDLQDAIVSCLGVEQRKRLTIGVELAAKPNLLLFLDEPTSGLDSQSAYSIVRFLKRLSKAGQAIICTIHQPSSVLIEQFDIILALNPGGNTFYFGPVGQNGAAVVKYFADRGVQCPPTKNVAEFLLETAARPGKGADGRRINWNQEWKASEENKGLRTEIERLKAERSKTPEPAKGTQHEFASPVWLQTTMLTKRLAIQYWRDASYLYGKLFVAVIVGIFNGFTFYQLGNSIQDMQNRMFTSFLIVLIPPTVVNAVVPKFYMSRALWEARELPSRIYGWVAFCTATVVCEIPPAIVTSTVYWLLWYFPTGLPTDSSTAGYVYLMTMLFFFFQASWGQWICAFAPSFTVISNVLPFFFVMFSLFNGVVRPYAQLSVFWRYWLYYLNPSTYWIGGVIAATLDGLPVTCADAEAARFNPTPGQTCAQYAGAFADAAPGYLINPTDMSNCGYCMYSVGNDYMSTLNIKPADKWRDFGIFFAFCCSNWALVYFFIYTVRIRGWSFGFATVFSLLGKGVDGIKKAVMPKKKKET